MFLHGLRQVVIIGGESTEGGLKVQGSFGESGVEISPLSEANSFKCRYDYSIFPNVLP